MQNALLRWVRQHQRLVVGGALVLFLAGLLLGAGLWQQGGSPPAPPEIITTLTDQCKLDPAHLSPAATSPGNYLHTCGARIYDAHGNLVEITGVSWFGFETSNMAPDGLYARNWETILTQLKALGYNTIRLPFSDDIFKPGAMPQNINYLLNPDLKGLTSLQVMDKIVAGARANGLKILLDRHRPDSSGQADLWYTAKVSEQQWIADWVTLAKRYKGDDTILGADLDNEPREGATWGTGDPKTDWHLAAQKAGNAILSVTPTWLIFVEGIEHTGGDWYWWGGDLEGVAKAPVVLNVPNRVVYSPHDYGPEVYPQGWFKDPSFPNNLPSVWDAHWGYIAEQNLAPVVLGEFGGKSVGNDPEGEWQRSLVAYLHDHRISYISWALNPTSGDTGGILQDDWLTVQSAKQNLYDPGQAKPLAQSNTAPSGLTAPIRLTYQSTDHGPPGPNVTFEVTLFNDSSVNVNLSDLTIRYWVAQDPANLDAAIDWASLGGGHATVKVVPSACGTQGAYLQISFDSGAGPLQGFSSAGPILVRYHHLDWSTVDPSKDYSHGASTTAADWPKVQVLQSGRLVWGNTFSC
jgi:endoglucanase